MPRAVCGKRGGMAGVSGKAGDAVFVRAFPEPLSAARAVCGRVFFAADCPLRERLGDEMVEMVQVEIDGKIVDMEGIQKTDEKGNATNFIKLRVKHFRLWNRKKGRPRRRRPPFRPFPSAPCCKWTAWKGYKKQTRRGTQRIL